MSGDKTIAITIDGQKIKTEAGARIWEVAQSMGVEIPRLCHQPGMEPVGVCRVCAVEVEGARTLVPSCHRKVEPGMVIHTQTERVLRAQKTLVAMLMADHGAESEPQNCELTALAERMEVSNGVSALPPAETPRERDNSSSVIAVDHSACILCDRCIRACTDVQGNNVIGRGGRGGSARIAIRCGFADGRIHLRLLRGVHGRLPHGRAHQQTPHAANRPWRLERGGFNLPLLRRGLRHHL